MRIVYQHVVQASASSHSPTAASTLATQNADERTANRIQQLEAIISDSSLGVVSRIKAKVERALLKNGDDDKLSLHDEITAIKKSSGASESKRTVRKNSVNKRYDDRAIHQLTIQTDLDELYQLALHRRREAKLRSEEQRIRLAEAEAALFDTEKEADEALKLSSELHDMQQEQKVHENKIQELNRKVAMEDMQLENIMVEVQDLWAMSELLEKKLLAKTEEKERAELQAIRDEVAKVLTEKESAVNSAKAVKGVYVKSIAERETKIHKLQRDVDIRHEKLQKKKALLIKNDALASDDQQLQTEKIKVEQVIFHHEQENKKLAFELERCKDQVATLEQVNEVQKFAIKSMNTRMSKKADMKKAFKVQDKEIQKITALLATEREKSEKLSKEAAHYKDSATDLSKSLCTLQEKHNNMKKEMEKQQQETREMRKAKRDIKYRASLEKDAQEAALLKDSLSNLEKATTQEEALNIISKATRIEDDESTSSSLAESFLEMMDVLDQPVEVDIQELITSYTSLNK